MQYRGYSGPEEVSYLFIDGAYLRGLIEFYGKECYSDPQIPLDYGKLAQGFTKVFYYDCLAPKKSEESDDDYAVRIVLQENHFKKLRSLRGWHVVEGIVKRTGKRAQQKEVDILIAVDMLTHTYRRNMHRVTFIAGDQDFRPLVDAVVREGMFIELWYGKISASSDLIFAADAHMILNPYWIHSVLNQQYQELHPLPSHGGSPEKFTDNGALIARGIDTDGLSIELYQSQNEFTLIRPSPHSYGYFMHMRHSDLGFLKKIHELTYTKCDWVVMN